ncbi:glycosyltransferase family 2 protein [Subtercola sp. RTI3]|uniref:glycosyltransferase family 2 protein n=1 Tax=Subtercola sp. RTI3 TaxID=3048639 RepID=UPI002B2228AC|nr:glycosyltransferase family 2 protein [Subtercola sp. RTI3]MEA9985957.1 glycosyltransferase family 2 protein [Subtercola sp. RTI3]
MTAEFQPAVVGRVSVIMVTYNSAHIVKQSLVDLPPAPLVEVIVVDNKSSDLSVETVLSARPDAVVIRNEENAGFAKAVNLGAARATGEYLLLLNPDAVINASALKSLVESMSSNSAIGIIAPLVTDSTGEFSTIAAGFFPTIIKMGLHASGISRLGKWCPALEGHYLFRSSRLSRSRDLDWVSGGCLLVRRHIWNSLDGLSERWFMYAEDIELCLRVRRAGYKVVLDPSAQAIHEIGSSSHEVQGRANPTWVVNLFDLYCRDLARNEVSKSAWRWTVIAGFRGRAAAYNLLRILRPSDGTKHQAQIERYRIFSAALQKTPRT